MNQAFAYARKSSEDKNKQVQSIGDQLQEIQKLQKQVQIPIIDTFTEIKTGKVSGVRTEFYKMLRRIEKGEADTIICWQANRIARNGGDGGRVIEMVDNGQIDKIITPNITYDRNNSYILWGEFGNSTKFSKDLSDIVKARLKLKAERGEYPGLAQIGYLNTPRRKQGMRKILVDEKKWDLMRKWWDMMITGISTVEASLEEITKLGLKGKKGKPISRSAAYMIFRNIFYTGNFKYSGKIYSGIHKPMVTMSEWKRVQQILDDKGKKRVDSDEFEKEKSFQGMLICGECGAHITMSKHIRKYKNGTKQTFLYYNCTKKLGPCSQPHLNAKYFNPQLKAYIESLELNPKFGDWIKRVLKRRNKSEFMFERKQQELKTKRLSDITDKKEKIYGMKFDGLITGKEFEAKKEKILIEEQDIKESYLHSSTAYWESVIDDTIDFAENVVNLFENGDIFTRQMILKILGSNLVLKDKTVQIKAKFAFVFLKDVQERVYAKNLWIEPKKMPILSDKSDHSTLRLSRGVGDRI